MSYINLLKENANILALVESIDEQRKLDAKDSLSGSSTSEPFDINDLNDTVDIGDQENGLEAPDDGENTIELSDDDKSIVRKNLQSMLDELSGDDISTPALEMILEEVANNCAYLNEAEEASAETPVEKNNLLKDKKDAIINYAKEVLELGVDNDGVIPDETSEENSEKPTEDTSAESSEEGSAEPEENKELAESDDTSVEQPGEDATSDQDTNDEDGSLDEGTCTECGEGNTEGGVLTTEPEEDVVEVNPEDVIKVVGDDEVEPIDIDGQGEEPEGQPEGEQSQLSEINDKLSKLLDALTKQQTVFEAAGLFGDYTNPNVEGKDVVINSGAQHADFQKKITPATKTGTIKIAELRDLASAPKKTEAATEEGRANEAEVAKANAGKFKKDSRDSGKSQTAPESGYNNATKVNTPKKLPAQKEVTAPVKAAIVREATEVGLKSFLEEARRIIHEGK